MEQAIYNILVTQVQTQKEMLHVLYEIKSNIELLSRCLVGDQDKRLKVEKQ